MPCWRTTQAAPQGVWREVLPEEFHVVCDRCGFHVTGEGEEAMLAFRAYPRVLSAPHTEPDEGGRTYDLRDRMLVCDTCSGLVENIEVQLDRCLWVKNIITRMYAHFPRECDIAPGSDASRAIEVCVQILWGTRLPEAPFITLNMPTLSLPITISAETNLNGDAMAAAITAVVARRLRTSNESDDETELFTRNITGFSPETVQSVLDVLLPLPRPPDVPAWCRTGQLVRNRTDGKLFRILAVQEKFISGRLNEDALLWQRTATARFEEGFEPVDSRSRWEWLEDEL